MGRSSGRSNTYTSPSGHREPAIKFNTNEGHREPANRISSGSCVGGGFGTSRSYTTDEGPRASTNRRMPSGSNVGGGLGSYTTDKGPRAFTNGRMPSGSNVGGGLGTSGSYTTDEGPRAPTNIRMPSGSNVGGGLGSYTTDEGPRTSTNRRMPSGSNVGGGLGTSGSYTTDEGPRAPTNIRMPSGSNVGGGLGSYTTDEGPRASTNRRMPSGSNVGGGLGTSSSYTTDEGPRASTNRRMPSGSNVGGGLGTSGSYTTDEGTRASTNRRMPSGSNVGGGLGTSGSYTTDEGQREPSNRRISDGSSLGGGFGTSSNCTRDEGHRQSSSFISAATHKGGNTVLTNYNSSGGPGAMKTEHNLRRRVTRLKKDQVSDTQESYSDHRRASTCLRRHGTKTTDTHNHESTVNDFSNPHDVMSSSSASGFGSTLRRREHTNNYYPASYSPDHTHTTGIGKDSGSTLQSHALPLTAGGSREKQKGKANYGEKLAKTLSAKVNLHPEKPKSKSKKRTGKKEVATFNTQRSKVRINKTTKSTQKRDK